MEGLVKRRVCDLDQKGAEEDGVMLELHQLFELEDFDPEAVQKEREMLKKLTQ